MSFQTKHSGTLNSLGTIWLLVHEINVSELKLKFGRKKNTRLLFKKMLQLFDIFRLTKYLALLKMSK